MATRSKVKEASAEPAVEVSTPPRVPTFEQGSSETVTRGAFMTGNMIVIFRDVRNETGVSGLKRLGQAAGISRGAISSSAEYRTGAMDMTEARDADIKHFDKLGVAVIKRGTFELARLASLASDDTEVMAVVPERFVFPASTVPIPGQPIDGGAGNVGDGGSPSLTPDYIQGKIDALQELLNRMGPPAGKALVPAVAAAQPFQDDAQSTWGLKAIALGLRAANTGQGIKVAILDTGIDLNHPDFLGRLNPANCLGFVDGAPDSDAQDTNGHGTHVAGTACGSQVGIPNPFQGRRYGVAPGAELFIGRVFPNATDQNIIAGITWAITQGCHVVNMSLETPVIVCGEPDPYGVIGRRALDAGTLLVAAAGNKTTSRKAGIIGPVAHPANSPFIMGVGAVDAGLNLADFTPRSVCPNERVDITGPGVLVFSSWPMAAGGYNIISGTSMAAPHVTGMAALISAANGGARGLALWNLITAAADANNRSNPARPPYPLNPPADYGFGLVH
jgi:subtilisin family serine protease